MIRLRFTVIAMCICTVAHAQLGVFTPIHRTPIPLDDSAFERTVQFIEERNRKFDEDYNVYISKYVDAIGKKDTTQALACIDQCIRINDNAANNSHYIEPKGNLLAMKADLLVKSDQAAAWDLYKSALGDYINKENYTKALVTVEKILVFDRRPSLLIMLALCYWKNGSVDEAQKILDEAYANGDKEDKSGCLSMRAGILNDCGDNVNAIKNLNDAIMMSPLCMFYYSQRADYEYEEHLYEEAINDWNHLLSKSKSGSEKRLINNKIFRAKYLKAKQDGDKTLLGIAKRELKKLSKIFPDNKKFLSENK